MHKIPRGVVDWLEHRTGLESAIKNFLYEEIPASSGWHQVLGSIAVFSFFTQFFTGILLAFNYAPTPGEAYNSLRYIVTELTAGRLMRGLHHWGASMMIVIVVLHMLQVFIWGSYKKPREATWMVGVVLLLITMAYGLTGYLLPWDNRAYWGTVVTTQIAGQAPIAGPYLIRLLGGSGGIGVVTFARFYATHVLLLPPLTMLLIVIHIYLVRKHGVAPAPAEIDPPRKFFPQQVFKDTVGIFIAFIILFTLAVAVKVPLGKLADPTDTSYIPRPEWYFLFLFQSLKFFEGPLEIVGSIILPTLAILALFLIPFIDRGKVIRVTQRTTAIGVVLLVLVGWGGLTAAAIATTPKQLEIDMAEVSDKPVESWQQLSAPELAGIGYFRRENCSGCHAIDPAKKGIGPDLTKTPTKKNAAQLIQFFKNPASIVPGTMMPPVALNGRQLNTLAAFLLKLNAASTDALRSAPQFAVEGAMVYETNNCGVCHQVNGVGTKVGPALQGIAGHRTREWVEQHFVDPQKMSPQSIMPAYKLGPKDLERLTSYVMGL